MNDLANCDHVGSDVHFPSIAACLVAVALAFVGCANGTLKEQEPNSDARSGESGEETFSVSDDDTGNDDRIDTRSADAGPGGSDAGDATGGTCDNGVLDGGETDVDCGGPECPGCGEGESCALDRDCESGDCGDDGTCRKSSEEVSCTNGQTDGGETDVDCGGPDCAACSEGAACDDGEDCQSGYCNGDGMCGPEPSCGDGVQNGDETGVDCGGSCTTCYTWEPDDWSECDASCGEGTKTRTVTCIEKQTGNEVDETNCPASSKPSESKSCSTGNSCWFEVRRVISEEWDADYGGDHDIFYKSSEYHGDWRANYTVRKAVIFDGLDIRFSDYNKNGFHAIYQCWEDSNYFLSRDYDCNGAKKITRAGISGRVGYLADSPGSSGQWQAIYNCHRQQTRGQVVGDDYISTDPSCNSGHRSGHDTANGNKQSTLGYYKEK